MLFSNVYYPIVDEHMIGNRKKVTNHYSPLSSNVSGSNTAKRVIKKSMRNGQESGNKGKGGRFL